MIATDMRMGMVEPYARVQFQVLAKRVAIHDVGTEAGGLEVRNDESPSATTVALILRVDARAQLVLLAQREVHTDVGGEGVLIETTLKLSVRARHIAVAHRLAKLLAVVVLPRKVSLPTHTFALPRGVTEHLEVVHPLIRQIHVATRVVVVDVRKAHLKSVGIGKEAALGV